MIRISRRWFALVPLAAVGCVMAAGHAADRPSGLAQGDVVSEESVRSAVARGLERVRRAGQNWQVNRTCFSCHHQTLPMLAEVEAARAGFPVDVAGLEAQADFSREYHHERLDALNAGQHLPGGAATAGYGLWALRLARRPPDETTSAVVSYLLQIQGVVRLDAVAPADADAPAKPRVRLEGPWLPPCIRPPLASSRVGTTVLALLGTSHYATESQRQAQRVAAEKAEAWLAREPLRDTEERVWRLLGLHLLGGDPEARDAVRATLLADQREDGGWAQTDAMASDAYATGQVLFVLQRTGTRPDDPVARRAVAYLLRTQCDDGSWRVESRLKEKAQPYFENGDPHGEHQFLSVAGTSWATAALSRWLSP
ncbi:MAG: prenyltransferase/squalene oxidase repeat-containing protein [Isosphaeraceae bacterium]